MRSVVERCDSIVPHSENKLSAQSTFELVPSRPRYPAISLQSAEVGVTKRDSKSVAYENRTKSAKCGGLETNGRRAREFRASACAAQCGGLRAKPVVIDDFSAAKSGGESWSEEDWRRERDSNLRYDTQRDQ